MLNRAVKALMLVSIVGVALCASRNAIMDMLIRWSEDGTDLTPPPID